MKYLFFCLVSLLFVSCKKDQAIIHGSVTYLDSNGTSHVADGATVYLYYEVMGGDPEMTQVTGTDGTYAFHEVVDGHHWVYGEITVNDTTYTGQMESVLYTEKDVTVEASLILE